MSSASSWSSGRRCAHSATSSRAAGDVRRPGGHRHRERPAVRGAGAAQRRASGEQPPGHRGAGAADGDGRDPAGDRLLADRPAGRARRDRREAARLCDADDVVIHRIEGDRYFSRGVSWRRADAPAPTLGSTAPSARSAARVAGRAMIDGATIHVRRPGGRDRRATPVPDTQSGARLRASHRACHAAAREGRSLGAIVAAPATRSRPFTDQQIALLETFADQAVIAIENARLFEELEREQSPSHARRWSSRRRPPRCCGSSPRRRPTCSGSSTRSRRRPRASASADGAPIQPGRRRPPAARLADTASRTER